MRKSRAKLLLYRYDAGIYSGGLCAVILREGDEVEPILSAYFGERWAHYWELVDTLIVLDSGASRILRAGYHEG